jgi:prepilin-type N-terminal cleavage/methylation domain-containing protein
MGRRRAFTLVELLVVIVVVGILAGLSLGALNMARESARVSSTKATIAKIDDIITELYASRLERRLPLTEESLQLLADAYTNSPKTIARVLMNAKRDLVRMEMPDRWNDVANADGSIRKPLMADKLFTLSGGNATWPQSTQMRRHYGKFRRALVDHKISRETIEKYGPAECLYSIVTTSPEAAGRFRDSEIGDADGDGLREFHDAWGRPIMFIRWPAGFLASNNADSDMQIAGLTDPFDPNGILSNHYGLLPLIVSAGPDGRYDISFGRKVDASQNDGDPYYRYTLTASGDLDPYVSIPVDDSETPATAMVGQPIDAEPTDGNENWYDNIHNHHLNKR